MLPAPAKWPTRVYSGEGDDTVKAIIIEDKDALALLDQLKLEKFEGPRDLDRLPDDLTDPQKRAVLDRMHRRFHYVCCRWLEEQGASLARR